MTLKSLTYCEYEGDPKYWGLERIEFGSVNLLVGRNATGKTRVLNVALSICRLISGQQGRPFSSGRFDVEVELSGCLYRYIVSFDNRKVIEEQLSVDGVIRLSRNVDGEGEVFYASEDKNIAFRVGDDTIALQNKNDRLQHPFINTLVEWAASVAHYPFGTDFGRTMLLPAVSFDGVGGDSSAPPVGPDNVVAAYINAYKRFGDDFDKAIIRDMGRLGYQLAEVAAEHIKNIELGIANPLLGLITVEKDLDGLRNPQFNMSQGMFRALSLVIYLNLAIFSREQRLMLIDDIGEGLDFERASQIIDLLVDAANREKIQVVMTSNDRFVMNKVPLEYWAFLVRHGKSVKAYTSRNSPEQFEEFKYIGLSNFDFFKDVTFH